MAKIATLTEYECSETLLYIIEVSATVNAVDNTFTITADYYLDNTNQYSRTGYPTIPANPSNNSSMTIAGQTQYFKAPAISGKGKHLLYTFVSNPIKAEDEIETKIHVGALHYCNEKIYINSSQYYNVAQNVQNFYDVTIAPIMRKSKSSIGGDVVLGEKVNITVSPEISGTTHKIGYSCGGETTYFYEGNNESVPLTLPLDLSAHNTTGTTVEFQLITQTFYNGTTIGEVTKTFVCNIPETVKPSCSIAITDSERLTDKYGGYVQGKSRFNIVVTPILAYNSPIVEYKVTANGLEYDTAEVTTKLIKNSGENEITVTLTDERGRSETFTEKVDVLAYKMPVVSDIHIIRCDENGVEQKSGNEYIKVTFDTEITPLNNKNSASYMLSYEKISGLQQVDTKLTEYTGVYSVVGGTFIFAADTSSAYTITVSATDDFSTTSSTRGGSSASVIFNILASGLGLCFGANATVENAVENTFLTYPSGGFMFPKFEGTAINTPITPNIYTVESGRDIDGSPTENPFTLIVLPYNDDDLVYIVIDDDLNIYIRRLTNSSLGAWHTISTTEIE